MAFTQKLFTSYHGYDNPDTRIGELNRIWYDSVTNAFRIQLDNSTPGGTVIGGGGGGGNYTLPVATGNTLGGVKIGSNITITSGVISVAAPFSGSYTDLTNKPSLFSGSYNDLSNKPSLFSGSYNDLTNKPYIPDAWPGIGTGSGLVVGDTSPTINSPTINDAVFQNTFSIGTQVFYTHPNGFSVNENFDITDPYGTQANFTGYHFTSGAGKTGVAFTLARTGNFTDGFGITGDAYNNNFVIGSETANTDYVFKTGIGMPFDVSGGTTIFTINRNGNLTFADTSVQTTAWLGYVTQVNSPSGGTYTALILNADGTISLPIVSSQSFSSIIDGSDNTQLTLAKFAGAYTKNAGNSNGGVWNSSGIAGSAINLFNDGHITLTTNNGAVPPAVTTYSFSNTGNFSIPASLTFPDTTVQSTAWLGSIDTIFKLNPSAGPGDHFRAGVQADLTNGVGINTSVGSGQFGTVYSWKFGFDGNMTFPDTSVQTTAYTDTRAKGLFSVTTNSASGNGSLSYSSGVFTFTPAVTYSLPTASTSTLGGVKLDGSTITIDGSGIISSNWPPNNTTGSSGPTVITIGKNTSAGVFGVSIGDGAGAGNQSGSSTSSSSINIGYNAGNSGQLDHTIAIGSNAGNSSQGRIAIAIGYQAGEISQGNYAIAIGANAGYSNQPANTIILNATSSNLNGVSSQTSSFYVAPVRTDNSPSNVLFYNTTTNEVTYGTLTAAAGTLTGTTLNSTVVSSSLTSVGTLTSLSLGGDLTTTQSTQNIFNTTATTITAFGNATTINLGYTSNTGSSNTFNISTQAQAYSTTKTVNIGTGSSSPSTTAINIGSTSGSSTVTLNGITQIGQATVASNVASTNVINLNTQGQLFSDGNVHLHSSGGSIWINALDGSDVNINTQVNSGVTGGGVTVAGAVKSHSRIFDWTAMIHASPASGGSVTGTLLTNASYSNAGDGVQLTSATTNQTGTIIWNITNFDFSKDFVMEWSWYTALSETNSADGIWVWFGGNSNNNSAATQPPSLTNGAIAVRYLTYTNLKTQWYNNGSTTGNAVNFRAGMTYQGEWMTSRIMVRSVGTKRYAYLYTGTSGVCDNAIDITSWSASGTWIGVGASTGGNYSTQLCCHVALDYM